MKKITKRIYAILFSAIPCLFSGYSYTHFSKVLLPKEIWKRQGKLSKEEVELILEEAKKGNAEYQLIAGIIYASGTTVEPDMTRAIEWWEKSALGGNTLAQRFLGVEYATGNNIQQNYEKAFQWYTKAMENGDLPATCNLGLMYTLGQYVSKDPKKAVKYYQKAADKDMPFAQILLGDMYFYGRGVELNRKKACELYKKALSSRDISSVAQNQIVNVYVSLGRAYCEKFADSGLTKNEGIGYLKKAFELGAYEAIRFLSLCENEIDEDDWIYQTASKHPDDASCLFALGVCYELGKGTSKNFELAFKCYQKSAEKGEPWGMHYLAYAYFSGQGVEKNLSEGFKWELLAAESVPQAQFNVGISYLQGNGVQQDAKEAEKWLKRASKNFYTAADEVLERMYKNPKQ